MEAAFADWLARALPPLPGTHLAGAVVLAWAVDQCWGEPPDALHPVAWFGRAMHPIGIALKRCPPPLALVGGALAWCAAVATLAVFGLLLAACLRDAPAWVAIPVIALVLKPCFAWRMLRDEVAEVARSLERDVEAGRTRLRRLVSRDVSRLDAEQVRESAIETLAENLNDSLVAPLFWFVLAGVPGALAYRAANTLDAMWGYRGVWEWAGKWSARADDVLSWLPARLTALLLVAWAPHGSRWRIGAALPAQACRTPSPNGGWPMGAIALVLGVRLRKPGVYALNGTAPSPDAGDLARALRTAQRAAWLGVALAAALAWGGGR